MNISYYFFLIRSDLIRYKGYASIKNFLVQYFFSPGYCLTFWLRTVQLLRGKKFLLPIYVITWLLFRHYSIKFGISIPARTSIGPGFYISHFGGIVINGYAKIGAICNISQGVTVGQANRGKRKGVPTIGDNVYIGPGAKLVGSVCIGNNVAIGANCVVATDIPDNAVVVGIPGTVISFNGSDGYVNRKIDLRSSV